MLYRYFQRARLLVFFSCSGTSIARADEARGAARPPLSESLEITEETCLTKEKVGDRLAPLLAATNVPEGLRIVLRVDADSKTTFVVSVGGETVGARSFDTSGMTCENKLKVVSIAIAVAIEGIVESRATKQRDPAEPAAPRPSPPPKPPPPRRSNVRSAAWRVGVGEGLFTTSLGASAAVIAGIAWDTSDFGVRASVVQTLGATVDVGPGSVRYALSLGRLHGCHDVVRFGAVVARACAHAGVGSFDARGVAFFSRSEGRSLWVDAGFAAEAHVAISRTWTLRGGIAPFAVLRGPTLRVTDARSGRIAASSAVPRIGALISLELAFRFDG